MKPALCSVHALLLAALACNSDPRPGAVAACAAPATMIDSVTRAQLVEARDQVWRAYFAADSSRLVALLPEQMVGMGQDRAAIIAEAQELARRGSRLVSLDFRCDEFFVSGDVAVVFSDYRVETRATSVMQGRAIEVFHRTNGRWLNPSWHLDER